MIRRYSRKQHLICYSSLLIALTAYGRTESFYMSSESGALRFIVYNILFLFPTFFACLYLGEERRVWLLPYGLFLGFYSLSLKYVNSKTAIRVFLPSLRVSFPITLYHILLFGLGFFFLILAMTVALEGKVRYRRILALYGALLTGLVYQDWFWFITHPEGHLACGSLYGVYFTWWIKAGSLCVPGMYVVTVLAGLSIMFLFGERSKEFILLILALLGGITLIGFLLG